MKRSSLLPLALLAAFSALPLFSPCLAAGDVPANAIGHWDTSTATEAEGSVNIPDTSGDNDLVASPEACATIKDDAEAPGGKALFFSGEQTKPAATKKPLILAGEEVFVHLRVRPFPGATDGSVLYNFASFELRYSSKKNEIAFLVWHGADAASVKAHIDADQWSEVSASIKGTEIELTVNGETVKGNLPEGSTMSLRKNPLWIGSADGRPFTGGIADITVAPSKE